MNSSKSSIKQAMIMAAGLGTRLRPHTHYRPKALLEYEGRPLLSHVLDRLISAGFKKIVINVHHFGSQVIDFVKNFKAPATELIISDERSLLLDTGGGLLKAWQYFETSPVLIHNVDILSNIDLNKFWKESTASSIITTLAVKERPTTRPLLFDINMQLCGWKNLQTGEQIITGRQATGYELAFSGIYIIRPEFIPQLPGQEVFPIMPEILRISQTFPVKGYRHDADEWMDMGKKEIYLRND
ncbi:MAG: NTP transferase domain-containing protein [Bacteroidales bacterium]|nr:NTP transferase domain-containing protein [Bacteroidales bacterium]